MQMSRLIDKSAGAMIGAAFLSVFLAAGLAIAGAAIGKMIGDRMGNGRPELFQLLGFVGTDVYILDHGLTLDDCVEQSQAYRRKASSAYNSLQCEQQ
jgi:hypothetical protein